MTNWRVEHGKMIVFLFFALGIFILWSYSEYQKGVKIHTDHEIRIDKSESIDIEHEKRLKRLEGICL